MSEIILTVESVDLVELYGENNSKLNLLREAFPSVTITSRGSSVKMTGEKKDTQSAKAKFEMMVRLLQEHKQLPVQMVQDNFGIFRIAELSLGHSGTCDGCRFDLPH